MTQDEGFTRREMRYLLRLTEEQQDKLRGGRFCRRLDFCISLALLIVVALSIRAFIAEPARGDIIICYYPGYTKSCVKRVIALGGETIEIRDGAVYIDGAPLDESAYWSGTMLADYGPVTVPAGEVFVMGDNRGMSKDSRNPAVGPIPRHKIVGRVFFAF